VLDVEELIRRYGPMVLRRCRRLLRDEEEAMDVCQDIFVRLLERRENLEVRYPSSLLYRIAPHICLNRIRDRKRRPTSSDEALLFSIASAEEPDAARQAGSILDRLFRRHPPSSGLIAVLHYLDGCTLDQVAELVGLSKSGVRRRLRQLRETLREWERR
jgi:RNA polymerase sigma-70 factor (ECF subfamily)